MRVQLGGFGDDIPLEALPDLTDLGDAVTVIFEADDTFEKTDWVSLGFTHGEIICVGGAGGRGGKSNFLYDFGGFSYEIYTMGGSGGGGGLEIVTIPLVDLPDSCPVVVGLAGTDGANGVYSYGAYGGSDGHGALDRGDPGTDGGYSTFNGTACRASGGKGGVAPPANNNQATHSANDTLRNVYPPGGDVYAELRAGGEGGQGGKGGQTTSGGGGLGAKSDPGGFNVFPGNTANTPQTLTEPQNGDWDGHIGEGGGGGRGGSYAYHRGYTVQGPARNPAYDKLHLAPYGGHGAFDFADTSVYGPRQARSADNQSGQLIVPGSGGGSRPRGTKHYGGRGSNTTPNGIVIVRLLKIE